MEISLHKDFSEYPCISLKFSCHVFLLHADQPDILIHSLFWSPMNAEVELFIFQKEFISIHLEMEVWFGILAIYWHIIS